MDKLGQGGFSKVYKCHDSSDQMCALKYVDLSKVDPTNLEGIKNEITHLNRLKLKRNIIQLLNHELTDKRLFIVLEYGELDLQQYITENTIIISSQIKSFWHQVC